MYPQSHFNCKEQKLPFYSIKGILASRESTTSDLFGEAGEWMILRNLSEGITVLINPVWSSDITVCRTISNLQTSIFARLFTSMLRREIGWNEKQLVGSLFFFNVKEMEAWVRVWGSVPCWSESSKISNSRGVSCSEKFFKNYLGSHLTLGTQFMSPPNIKYCVFRLESEEKSFFMTLI